MIGLTHDLEGGKNMKSSARRVKLTWPSPALVVACLALLVALGGTSYAVTGPSKASGSRTASAASLSGYQIVTASSTNDSAPGKLVVVKCGKKQKVVGGGYHFNISFTPAPIHIQESIPLDGREWHVFGYEDSAYAGNWQVVAAAICVDK